MSQLSAPIVTAPIPNWHRLFYLLALLCIAIAAAYLLSFSRLLDQSLASVAEARQSSQQLAQYEQLAARVSELSSRFATARDQGKGLAAFNTASLALREHISTLLQNAKARRLADEARKKTSLAAHQENELRQIAYLHQLTVDTFNQARVSDQDLLATHHRQASILLTVLDLQRSEQAELNRKLAARDAALQGSYPYLLLVGGVVLLLVLALLFAGRRIARQVQALQQEQGRQIAALSSAQQQLRSNSRELEALLAAMPDPYWRIGYHDHLATRYNQPAQCQHPLPREATALTRLLPEDAARTMLAALHRLAETQQAQQVEYQIGGSAFEVRLSPLNASHGVAMIRDISQQQAVQQQLARSAASFQALAATVPVPLLILGAGQLIVRYVNQAFCTLFGYQADELLAQELPALYAHDADRDLTLAIVQQQGELHNQEFEAYARDGQRRWVSLSMRPIHYQSEPAFVVTAFDLTERRRAEELLTESETKFRALYDHSDTGMMLFDDQGLLLDINPAMCRMLGYRRDALLGRDFITLTPPEYYASTQQQHAQIRQYGRFREYEKQFWRADGSRLPVSLSGVGFTGRDGKLRSWTLVTDISTRLEGEAKLARSAEAAEAANRAKSAFLANMSHEIRTPLNAVLGFATLLRDTRLNPEQNGYIEGIRNAGDTLLTLISDVLDLSKIEADRLELESMPFNLRQLLEDVLELIADKADQKNLQLSYHCAETLPCQLQGDAGRLKQILLNYANNAVKFTEHGSVHLLACAAANPATGPSRQRLRLTVCDTGIGIDEVQQGKLFSPFSQADASTTRRYGGTGLGLSICKKLAEAMHGAAGVDSAPGQGSQFWVEVELERYAAPPTAPRPPLPAVALGEMPAAWAAQLTEQLLVLGHTLSSAEVASVYLGCRPSGKSSLPWLKLCRASERSQQADSSALALLSWPVKSTLLAQYLQRDSEPMDAPPADDALPSYQLLLVEDNPINQKVASVMLGKLGQRVDIAHNGEEAVAAVQRTAYDLVFMDCQMPVMDGFEATWSIRGLDSPASRVPIVALTANALQGDKERCVDVGMNDYVTKPVSPQSLRQAIVRWAGRRHDSAAPSSQASSRDSAYQALVAAVQQHLDGLQASLGEPLCRDLVRLFRELGPNNIKELERAFVASDWGKVAMAANRLKGDAAQLGASALADVCLTLELAADSHDQQLAGSLLDTARQQVDALLGALATPP